MGSILVARRAGIRQPRMAAENSRIGTTMKVTGSWALTPNNCVSRKRAEHERDGQAEADADADELETVGERRPEQAARRRAEREPQAQFLRALGDRKRDHRIEADEGQDERQRGKDTGEKHRETLPGDGIPDDVPHGADPARRLVAVELVNRRARH